MTNYKGYELPDLTPNVESGTNSTASASLSIVSSAVGARHVRDRRGMPAMSRELTITATGLEQVQALRGFIARRKGRVVPFWLTTGQADAILALPAATGATALTIKSTGYAGVFAVGNARRNLKLPNGQAVKATALTTNGNGTETLYIDTPLTSPLAADAILICLVLCRLAGEDVALRFYSTHNAETTVGVIELPKEAP